MYERIFQIVLLFIPILLGVIIQELDSELAKVILVLFGVIYFLLEALSSLKSRPKEAEEANNQRMLALYDLLRDLLIDVNNLTFETEKMEITFNNKNWWSDTEEKVLLIKRQSYLLQDRVQKLQSSLNYPYQPTIPITNIENVVTDLVKDIELLTVEMNALQVEVTDKMLEKFNGNSRHKRLSGGVVSSESVMLSPDDKDQKLEDASNID